MKKPSLKSGALSLALAAGMVGSAAWSTASYACSTDPTIASICIMAMVRSDPFNGAYRLANGDSLQLRNFQALYSLLGTTYGGDGVNTFFLPDLRGRVVVGAGRDATGRTWNVGEKAGNASITLTSAQLPVHFHTLNAGSPVPPVAVAAVAMTGVTAATSLAGLTATTSLSGVTATASGAGLSLNGSSGGTSVVTPGGASLGTTTGTSRIYSSATPSTSSAMLAGSITGTLPVTFAGSPTTNITGTATTTLSGAPTATISGRTDGAGASAAVPTLPPYLVMNYFIAYAGMYPSWN